MEKFFDKLMDQAPAIITVVLLGQKLGYIGTGPNTPGWFRPSMPTQLPPANG